MMVKPISLIVLVSIAARTQYTRSLGYNEPDAGERHWQPTQTPKKEQQ